MECYLRFRMQLFLVAAIVVVLVLLLASCYYFDLSDGSAARPYFYDTSSRNCSGVSKWVVTTSNAMKPPEAVHVILSSTKDWCVLVLGKVAGSKYKFSWTNSSTHLIYLPREALLLLPYKSVTLPSLDVRNIGYLYAIANGARVVLDLEDGIVPIRVNHTYLPLQADKREYACPNIEEKEGKFLTMTFYMFTEEVGSEGEGEEESGEGERRGIVALYTTVAWAYAAFRKGGGGFC